MVFVLFFYWNSYYKNNVNPRVDSIILNDQENYLIEKDRKYCFGGNISLIVIFWNKTGGKVLRVFFFG